MYLQNSCTGAEMNNQTSEGFLSSILGEDDLHLMDMAMNEGEFFFFDFYSCWNFRTCLSNM